MSTALSSLRRSMWIGALVVGVVVALCMPAVALAANTATFSSKVPAPNSTSTNVKPTLSVVVYDKYGIWGTTNFSMTLDGVAVRPKITYLSGQTKLKMSYLFASPLSNRTHTVKVTVRDKKRRVSSSSWNFTTNADATPPSTTSNSAAQYFGVAAITLSAVDTGSGVANTYYVLDNGLQQSGTYIPVPQSSGYHVLKFWSVDNQGNVESPQFAFFQVVLPQPFVHETPANSCTVTGCHSREKDVATIHLPTQRCDMCHGLNVVPSTNCAAASCHGENPPYHTADTHPVIPSVPAAGQPSCTQSTCHGTVVVTIHNGNCATCHASDDPTVQAAIASGNAHCETCHTQGFDTIHAAGAPNHVATIADGWAPACYAQCHGQTQDVAAIHTNGDDPPGCAACHAPGVTPSRTCAKCHTNLDTVHNYVHPDATGQKSSACTSCHSSDLPTAHQPLGCFCHFVPWLRSEMGPLLVSQDAECVSCHKEQYAAHGFNMGASGHNTTTYGRVGAYTKFDGSQGPILKWESEIASASLNATWLVEGGFQPATRPEGITSISVGQEGTVTTDWDFPTVNVFWASGDASAPVGAITGLDKDSVISCQDCHTGLNAAGPHGAADNWGIDPNFPKDYSYAELTKDIVSYPSGIKIRSTLTTATQSYTSGMTMICSKCHDLQNIQSGTTANSPLPLYSTGGVAFDHNGETFTPVWYTGGRSAAWTVWTDINGHPVDGSTSATQSAQAWSQAATATLNTATIGSSNTAHSSHHQDNADGSPQCVNCHIGVPHGWKAPRLLVNTGKQAGGIPAGTMPGDQPPYLSPNFLGTTRSGSGAVLTNGFNRIGMLTLSAVDQHHLNAGSTWPNPSGTTTISVQGMVYNTGAAYWSEASCQACNDHSGEDGIRIIDTSGGGE